MLCPKCKTENPDNAASCWFCNCALPGVAASGPAQRAKTSGLAIASLILGALAPFTCFITAIPAIVLGIVGLVKISKSAGQLKGNGLAIAGIAVPFALLPVFALMMGILMPALARVRQVALRTVCANNLRQLGLSIQMYADENSQKYPTADKWCDLLKPYYKAENILVCPSAGYGQCHYAINPHAEPNSPPDMVLLFETHPGWNQTGGTEILSTENHQGDGCNIIYVDRHIQFVRTKDLKNLRWTTRENEISPPEPIPVPP